MSAAALPPTGELDVNELSQKLSVIPVLPEQEEEEEGSEASSNAAVFGSEAGGK